MKPLPVKLYLLAFVALVMTGIALWWWRPATVPQLPSANLSGVILPQPREIQPFTLIDQEGRPFTLENLKGRWTLLFFGYTHCPDICPTTLTVLKGVAQKLAATPELANSTSTVFVSVDPRRDAPAQLKEYLAYFNPSFVAATGSKEQIDNLATQVGAIYMFEGDTRREDYIVNHSAAILLIDPQGRLYGRFDSPHTASNIAESYRRLRAFHDR